MKIKGTTILTGSKKKAEQRSKHRRFLLSFFEEPHDTYTVIEVNGFVLNRYFPNKNNIPFVMLYTKDSWKRSQQYKEDKSLNETTKKGI